MHLDTFRDLCLALPHATEGQPFGPDVLVFKVGGKMFALLSLDVPAASMKADPERAVEQRERYAGVAPGYHLNKRHWNTVDLQGDVPATVIEALLGDSYRLVWAGLSRRLRESLGD